MLSFAREAWPLVLPPLVIGIMGIFGARSWNSVALLVGGVFLCVLALAILLFFRDPHRVPPPDQNSVAAPADGVVVEIETLADGRKFVAIFLSVFNVHVNRSPFSGTVKSVVERPGTYRHANSRDGAQGNARIDVELESSYGLIRFSQLSGFVARKISCRVRTGEMLNTGDRFGLIYFGSRMEVELPATAVITATLGQVTKAGETVIAQFPIRSS
ncbi:MAG: phosphatidylserine decarboxylase [bacterium]|nr:phosphatidylserine decarboxylase [bacterium]